MIPSISMYFSNNSIKHRIESQRQIEFFGPSVTHSWATEPRWGRSAAMVKRRTLGQNNSLSPSPAHLSRTTSTLSRIKCERYIFIKKCVRSFIHWSSSLCLNMFWLYLYMHMYAAIQQDAVSVFYNSSWLGCKFLLVANTCGFLYSP